MSYAVLEFYYLQQNNLQRQNVMNVTQPVFIIGTVIHTQKKVKVKRTLVQAQALYRPYGPQGE